MIRAFSRMQSNDQNKILTITSRMHNNYIRANLSELLNSSLALISFGALCSLWFQADEATPWSAKELLSAVKDSPRCICPWNLHIFKSWYLRLSKSWGLMIFKLKDNTSTFIIRRNKLQKFNQLRGTITISHALQNTICSFSTLFRPDFVNLN